MKTVPNPGLGYTTYTLHVYCSSFTRMITNRVYIDKVFQTQFLVDSVSLTDLLVPH